MTSRRETVVPGQRAGSRAIQVHAVRVWDLPTRLFHWLLAAAVTVAMVTGFVAPEWWMGVHIGAGYAAVALLVFRFVWGVFGPEYARLVNFAKSARYLRTYLRGLAVLRPPHYVGHNPVGALMIFAFFAVFTGLVITGLMVEGGEEKQGPFAGVTPYAAGTAAKEIHEGLAFLALAMIAVHIAGVLIESRLQGVSLVRGMITGWMPVPENVPVPSPRPARPLAAGIVLSGIVLAAALGLAALSRLPPLGVPVMPENALYRSECGACHWAYHPSLLPRQSWAVLMENLGDHFGEDASLSKETADGIARHLSSFAAEAWDTEAANRFRTVSPEAPLRITRTPYWQTKHGRTAPEVFKSPKVKSAGNCIACHRDADTGRFDDQNIRIPKEP